MQNDIMKKISSLTREVLTLTKRNEELKTQIARYTAAGCQDYTEYWTGKDKKYMYKLFPMKNGKRRKEYVGNQEYKIKEARQKQENYDIRRDLIVHHMKIEDRFRRINETLGSITIKTQLF